MRTSIAISVLLLCTVGGVAVGGPDDAPAQERRSLALEAIESEGDGAERSQAVAHLAALDTPDAAKALVECVTKLSSRRSTLDAQHRATTAEYKPYAGFVMKEKGDWVIKRRLLDRLMSEDSRQLSLGVLARRTSEAIARLRNAAAIAVVERACAAESDVHARHLYVCGLVANASAKAEPIAKRALRDEAPLVRLGAYEAMAARRDAALRDIAAQGLKEPGWPMRRAALRSLEAIGDVRAVPAIVGAMQAEDGALLEDYAAALAALTGQTLGRNPDAWAKWCESNKEVLAAAGARPATRAKAPAKPRGEGFSYYGVETVSRRVLFVVDISGSMLEEIGGPAPVTGVSRKDMPYTGRKIDIAKRILLDAVQKLDPATTFNIVWFNHGVQAFQERMVAATPKSKAEVEEAVLDLRPAGATWAYGALRKAFEFAGAADAPLAVNFDPQVDTIFFVSDGAPTDDSMDKAKPMDPETILAAVRDWNRAAGIRIHAIAIDPRIGAGAMIRFMKGLAAENGGTYTAIGAN